jgi:hypothetical protein
MASRLTKMIEQYPLPCKTDYAFTVQNMNQHAMKYCYWKVFQISMLYVMVEHYSTLKSPYYSVQ